MKKILIVDDNLQNLYMLEMLLQSNGYEVMKASNGKIGLDLANSDHPDMVISDILMPTMDGFSLCREWRKSETLHNIPFIFYTATYTDPKDEAFALSLGADEFLVKPLEPEDLLSSMKKVFDKKAISEESHPTEVLTNGNDYYKTYSETLVRKLEEKSLKLERANKRMEALYKASCEFLTLMPTVDMIQKILITIVETAGYEQVNYFDYLPNERKLVLSASFGFSKETETTNHDRLVFSLGEETGLVGKVALTGKIVNIPETTADPRWIPLDTSIHSALFIPVIYEKNIRGVLSLFSQQPNAFDSSDEQDLTALVNSLAIAIENQNNQNRVQKQLDRLSALHNIDVAINSNMDLRATLNTVLAQVMEQLSVDSSDIIIYNRYTMTYEYGAGIGYNSRPKENHEMRQRMFFAEKAIMERRLIHVEGDIEKTLSPEVAEIWRVEGLKAYWGIPLIARGEVKGVLEVMKRTPFEPDEEWYAYLETLAGQAAIAIDSSEMFEGLQRNNIDLRIAYDATIEGWSRALDLRDNETEYHTLRVVETSLELAAAMGIKNDDLIHIKRGALLHDIGKMGVPDEILHKPGPLTDEEWLIMRKHPQFAYEMLSPIGYLHRALDIPSCHHEKWDGTGYPRGLKGEQIPLAARLFAIVDVWDALRSDRPYRKAWPEEKVLEYLKEQSGKHFDPMIVEVFLNLLKKKNSEI